MELQRILRLARSGALERAWSLLIDSGLGDSDEPGALTLKARLIKDRAKRASAPETVGLFAEAAGLYERAARKGAESYPLINAATLWLLAGQPQRSEQLARRVLELLERDPDEAETRYWFGATKAEALLLLGKNAEATAALRAAVKKARKAWEDHAATLGQFSLICDHLGVDASWLDGFRPPRSVQYSGIMSTGQNDREVQRKIEDWLEKENVGFGFGALAAGADIWIAEALIERGAELHVILPCPPQVFREKSVAAVDPDWLPRFDRLLKAASSVDQLDTAQAPSPAAVIMASEVALGLGMNNARLLESEALRLRLESGAQAPDGSRTGPVRDMRLPVRRQSSKRDFQLESAGRPEAMVLAPRRTAKSPELFDNPLNAWRAARRRLQKGEPAVLDYQVRDDERDRERLTERLYAMADVAEGAQALATKAMAFSLLSQAPALRIEEMGEIRASDGYFSVYSII